MPSRRPRSVCLRRKPSQQLVLNLLVRRHDCSTSAASWLQAGHKAWRTDASVLQVSVRSIEWLHWSSFTACCLYYNGLLVSRQIAHIVLLITILVNSGLYAACLSTRCSDACRVLMHWYLLITKFQQAVGLNVFFSWCDCDGCKAAWKLSSGRVTLHVWWQRLQWHVIDWLIFHYVASFLAVYFT